MAEYKSQWKDKIDELAAQIQNRDPFQIDFNTDPMARNARDQAILGGQRAMSDTMARASAMTGGQLSSYSQAVGQQQYNRYMQDLLGKYMGIAQLAMERYDREGDDLRDRLGYLQGEDAKDYGRWKDAEAERIRIELEDYRRKQDEEEKKWREDQEAYKREQDEKEWQHMLDREAIEDQRYADALAAKGAGGGGGGGGGGRGRGGGGGGGGSLDGYTGWVTDPDMLAELDAMEIPVDGVEYGDYQNFSPWDNPWSGVDDWYAPSSSGPIASMGNRLEHVFPNASKPSKPSNTGISNMGNKLQNAFNKKKKKTDDPYGWYY